MEETLKFMPDWDKMNKLGGQDVLPVAVQHAVTREVLLLAYTNAEALRETLRTGALVLWSTSRGRLWRKGSEESGNAWRVEEIRVNCEQNSFVYLVAPLRGGMCHTKGADGECRESCYYRRVDFETSELEFL